MLVRFAITLFQFIKPVLPLALVVAGLQISGQLPSVVSFSQSAMLSTGLFNADTDPEAAEAFDFNIAATSLDGRPLDIESLANKVVFLNIWATWCGPCRAEMPTIQNLYATLKDRDIAFVMLSIDRKDPLKKVKEYISKGKYTFPVYILAGLPTEQLRVPSIPTTFIISKEGKVIRKEVGMTNFDTEKFKKFLLKEAAK
jgi:thiol-disulfide isomerase/thioredoxin